MLDGQVSFSAGGRTNLALGGATDQLLQRGLEVAGGEQFARQLQLVAHLSETAEAGQAQLRSGP